MRTYKIYLFALSFLFSFIGANAQQNLNEALRVAKKENKLIFIDCYFTGCIPCKQMDDDVFPNQAVKAEMSKNFIMMKVDVFKDKLGDTLKVQYILNGFPTFLVLNGDGKLVNSISGYKDPGDLISFLNDTKSRNTKGKLLNGYSSNFKESDYPELYLTFAKTRKGLTPQNLEAYSNQQKDFKATNSLMPFLIARNTNDKVSAEILRDYSGYATLYGEEVLQPVVDRILTSAMQNKINATSSDTDFNSFIASYQSKFPADRWKINLQTIGTKYYLEQKKDTIGYLRFAVKNPVLYQYYFTSLTGMMTVRKQIKGEASGLLCQWADAIVNPESSMEIIKNAASINKMAGNTEGYKKFMLMAIARAKKYQMDTASLEKSLASL